MELSLEKIQQLNSIDIYNHYKSDFDYFFSNLSKISMSEENFKRITLEEIQESKDFYNGEVIYSSYILSKINKRIQIEKELYEDQDLKEYISELKKFDVLPSDEIFDLIKKAQDGDKEAQDKIVKHNIRLVLSIAKKYVGLGIPFEDLIQEGTIGLYSAIEKFDFEKGTKFSTYATWWIKNNIFKTLYNDTRNIRLPIHLRNIVLKYKKAFTELYNQLEREPTVEEVAERLHISQRTALTIYKYQVDTISINQPVASDSGDETELSEFIEADEDVEKEVMQNTLKEDLLTVFDKAKLTEREKYIIIHRFGLFNTKKQTLVEIGKDIGLTRERVRQLEKNSLEKLKNNKLGKGLKYYLGDKVTDEEDYLSLESSEEKLNCLKLNLTPEIFNHFLECNLYPLEMEMLALSLGLLGEAPKDTEEIATIVNKPYGFVKKTLKTALSKVRTQEEKKKKKQKEEKEDKVEEDNKNETDPTIPIYERLGITEKQFEKVLNKLSVKERNVLYKKLSKENSQEYRSIIIKIKNIVEQIQEEERKKEIIKELNQLKKNINNINFDEIKKNEKFYELTKYFSVKETVAVLLLFGYYDDSYYAADYVSRILGMNNSEMMNVYGRANMMLKYNNETMKEKRKVIAK